MEGDRAWILRICMAPGWRQRGLGSALITTLGQRLFADGVRAVHAVLPEGETGAAALRNARLGRRPVAGAAVPPRHRRPDQNG
ncbi:GNAT family N-acetyltransferase [Streptomyces sp. NPDC006706]|uniref:GNAT family N-acetyltransferase n=1 Tax=Streptomyces sp. NPDC006706 TaxID=3364761 RepID=UPI0036B647B8